eukprot:jgi/Chlat1/2342/Chrsp17S02804
MDQPVASATEEPMRIGVLALQGSFREHCTSLRRCSSPSFPSISPVEVRRPDQLEGCRGLIIPGGESTTMANVAVRAGLGEGLEVLKAFAAERPVWGTCAGLILLANKAYGQKEGGQALIGGLDVTVHRNFFGSQLNSFEASLTAPACLSKHDVPNVVGEDPSTFRAVFIRAPGILQLGEGVEVLAECPVAPEDLPEGAPQTDKVVVAVRQNNLLATAFHPELTADNRWHQLFVDMCSKLPPYSSKGSQPAGESLQKESIRYCRPADLPVR